MPCQRRGQGNGKEQLDFQIFEYLKFETWNLELFDYDRNTTANY